MTLITTKTPESSDKHALQKHHQQAGEHLQQAASSHLAAAKTLGAGDEKAAQAHAQIASDHTAHARQQVAQAEKISAPGSASPVSKAK